MLSAGEYSQFGTAGITQIQVQASQLTEALNGRPPAGAAKPLRLALAPQIISPNR